DAGAARPAVAGPGAHVAARGTRERRHEPPRAASRSRAGAHGARAPGPSRGAGAVRAAAEAPRARDEDAPVRGGRGVRRGGRARGGAARDRRRLARARGAPDDGGAVRAEPVARARRRVTVASTDRLARALDGWRARLRGLDELAAPVVVACSGGADSLALLALASVAGLQPVAVHVDHGLRDGSAHEYTRVALAPGPNLEARARASRYAALRDARDELRASAILVGHTADDQAETVLLN